MVKQYQLTRLFVLMVVFSILHSPFSILTPTRAYAEKQTLRVSPVIITVPLSPGKTITNDVAIENLTNTPLPLRATLNDFVTGGEEGGYVFQNTRTNPLLSWIKLDENEFILNPHEKKKLKMTIKTPTKIQVGGYYGILFFEPVLQTPYKPTTQVSTRVGVLLLGNLGVPDNGSKRADILTFTPPKLSQDGTVPFLLRVQNTSLNFFTAKPIITLTRVIPDLTQDILDPRLLSSDMLVKPIYLEEKLIFPDKVRRWTEDQTIHDLSPNIYKLRLTVATGNGRDITTDKYIVVFPVIQAGEILIVFLILFFLIRKRKRFGKAAKALFRS